MLLRNVILLSLSLTRNFVDRLTGVSHLLGLDISTAGGLGGERGRRLRRIIPLGRRRMSSQRVRFLIDLRRLRLHLKFLSAGR